MIAYRAARGGRGAGGNAAGREAGYWPAPSSATVSISTSMRGSTRPVTSTIVISGADLAEDLAVGAADLLGAGDVGDVDAGLDHVGEAGAGAAELVLDLAEDLDRLVVGRVAEDDAVGVDRGGATDDHEAVGPRPRG